MNEGPLENYPYRKIDQRALEINHYGKTVSKIAGAYGKQNIPPVLPTTFFKPDHQISPKRPLLGPPNVLNSKN